jgi:hypothetical protein
MRWVAAVLILLVLAGVAPVLMSIGCVGFDDSHLTACGPIVAIAWQWQSLIGGLLALIGAGFAGWMVKKQIDVEVILARQQGEVRARVARINVIKRLAITTDRLLVLINHIECAIDMSVSNIQFDGFEGIEFEKTLENTGGLTSEETRKLYNIVVLSEKFTWMFGVKRFNIGRDKFNWLCEYRDALIVLVGDIIDFTNELKSELGLPSFDVDLSGKLEKAQSSRFGELHETLRRP